MTVGSYPVRVVAPAVLPISLDEVKAHLRVTNDAEILLLDQYIRAAVSRLEDYTGLGLLLQTWTQTFPAFASPMILYRRPLLIAGSPGSVASVTYVDGTGSTVSLSDTVYRVTGVGVDRAYGAIRLASGQGWPATLTNEQDAITVTYTVGYGINGDAVPEVLRHALLMMVADAYSFRESLHPGSLDEIPSGAMSLIREWRPLAVA